MAHTYYFHPDSEPGEVVCRRNSLRSSRVAAGALAALSGTALNRIAKASALLESSPIFEAPEGWTTADMVNSLLRLEVDLDGAAVVTHQRLKSLEGRVTRAIFTLRHPTLGIVRRRQGPHPEEQAMRHPRTISEDVLYREQMVWVVDGSPMAMGLEPYAPLCETCHQVVLPEGAEGESEASDYESEAA
jgi:hypothetical protein